MNFELAFEYAETMDELNEKIGLRLNDGYQALSSSASGVVILEQFQPPLEIYYQMLVKISLITKD